MKIKIILYFSYTFNEAVSNTIYTYYFNINKLQTFYGENRVGTELRLIWIEKFFRCNIFLDRTEPERVIDEDAHDRNICFLDFF